MSYRFTVSNTKVASPSGRRLSPARVRAAARAGAVAAVTAAPLLAAAAANAATATVNYYPGTSWSALKIIGVFVGIPVGLFVLIAVLVCLPGWVRGDSNRREVGWSGRGSADAPQDKVSAGQSGSGTGGASGTW